MNQLCSQCSSDVGVCAMTFEDTPLCAKCFGSLEAIKFRIEGRFDLLKIHGRYPEAALLSLETAQSYHNEALIRARRWHLGDRSRGSLHLRIPKKDSEWAHQVWGGK